jgi:hypothetical protein
MLMHLCSIANGFLGMERTLASRDPLSSTTSDRLAAFPFSLRSRK